MSEILEELARLERELVEELFGENAPDIVERALAKVHRHTMLVARAVFVWAQSNAVGRSVAVLSAREIFPLPPRRVPREEPDPDNPTKTLYRCNEGTLEWLRYVGPWEEMKESSIGAAIKNSETPGAVAALFASLYAEPYREEPDERDR